MAQCEMMFRYLFPVILLILLGLSGCGSGPAEIFPPVVFKPEIGSFSNSPIQDNLSIKTLDAATGNPLKGAVVMIHQGDPPELLARDVTGPDGTVSFAGKGINGPVCVTVTGCEKEAYDTISFIDINAAEMTIPLVLRKAFPAGKASVTFLSLDSGDDALMYYVNDQPQSELKISSSGKKTSVNPDPYSFKMVKKPSSVSALATDPSGTTTKFGFSVFPNGPLPVSTPAMIKMNRISSETVKVVRGKLAHPPANLKPPKNGWDTPENYSLAIFADGGIAGDVFAGFGNIMPDFKYEAFCCKTTGLENLLLKVTAYNRSDFWAESSQTLAHYTFDTLPETLDLTFKNVPKELHQEWIEGMAYPELKWKPGQGNLEIITIRHDEYNYTWKIYSPAQGNTGSLMIPPLTPGSEGALIEGEEYRFRVETLTISDFDYNSLSFQSLRHNVDHRARSSRQRFLVREVNQEVD
jgi:hypothetical protein